MVYNCLLLRIGELFLKGKNRNYFDKKLAGNVKKIVGFGARRLRNRLVIDYFTEHNKLRRIFGLSSYSPALKVDRNLVDIKEAALKLLEGKKETFRIETKRSDKSFPLKSPEVNTEIGIFIEEKSALEFSLKNFEHKLNIEINQDGAYLFFETVNCFGGLPVGSGDGVVLLVENEASLLAGLLFMKRGCSVFPAAFEEKDILLLQKFSPNKLNLKIVKDFSELEIYAREKELDILVSGESFDDLKDEKISKTELVVMRPLVSYSCEKIKKELKTFEK